MKLLKNIKQNAILFFVGFLGILSIIPLISRLSALQPAQASMSVTVVQVVALLQSSILLLLMIWLGSVFSRKVNLLSPLILAVSRSENIFQELKPQIVPAIIGGITGGGLLLIFSGVMSSYLPPEFLSAGAKLTPSWYSKILYGGITEEILIRWGLMSFFVWAIYRITQKKGSDIRAYNYVAGIVLSALLFGAGHLPVAFALSPEVTLPLVVYIIFANAAFGLIAGYLYWKRGLECAMGSHMIAHIIMIMG